MKPEDEAKLASLPVRQIPKDLLADYNDGAKPNKTTIEEVKHFLPRYLDLIAQFQFPTHSAELSFSRLIPFDKTEWTKQELDLLNQFTIEYFKHCLSIYPLPSFNDRIDTILIMLWKAGFNVGNLLTIWESEKQKKVLCIFVTCTFTVLTNTTRQNFAVRLVTKNWQTSYELGLTLKR